VEDEDKDDSDDEDVIEEEEDMNFDDIEEEDQKGTERSLNETPKLNRRNKGDISADDLHEPLMDDKKDDEQRDFIEE
jgi:hypothetical protein